MQKQRQPLKEKDNNNPQDQYFQDMKRKLHMVFKFYASFGDRINVNHLKSNKLHKMIVDANLKSHLDQTQLDLMFTKICKTKPSMDFDQFLQFLPLIAQNIHSKIPTNQALIQLLDQNFSPLYDNIISQTDLGDEQLKFEQPIDFSSLQAIKLVLSTITKIYKGYFPMQYKQFRLKEIQEDIRQKSIIESSLFTFLKDFDICPTIITKSTAYLLFTTIIEDDQLPKISQDLKYSTFTLNKFCCYLIKLAYLTIEEEELCPVQKLGCLLDRMELSQGFQNIDLKIPNNQVQNQLKLDNEIINQLMINPHEVVSKQISSIQSNKNQDDSLEDLSKRISTSQSQKYKRSMSQTTTNCTQQKANNQQCQLVFQQCQEQLQQIYRFYGGVNQETGQENELSGSKWFKFLKDANIVQQPGKYENLASHLCQIPHSDVDLIFYNSCKLTKRNQSLSKRQTKLSMNYQKFLKGIQLICEKIYSEIDSVESLKTLLIQNVLPLATKLSDENQEYTKYFYIYSKSSNSIKEMLSILMSLLQDEQVVEFLGLLHKAILVYYKHYANSNGLMTSDKYIKFYKDFEIFPDLLSKNKLLKIFATLSKLHQQNHMSDPLVSIDPCIDQHMFVESLALSGMEIQINQEFNHVLEKICYLVERMNQSEGPRIVQKQLGHTKCPLGPNWDLTSTIKKRFPWLFEFEGLE